MSRSEVWVIVWPLFQSFQVAMAFSMGQPRPAEQPESREWPLTCVNAVGRQGLEPCTLGLKVACRV